MYEELKRGERGIRVDGMEEEEEKDLIYADKERHCLWGRRSFGGGVDRKRRIAL